MAFKAKITLHLKPQRQKTRRISRHFSLHQFRYRRVKGQIRSTERIALDWSCGSKTQVEVKSKIMPIGFLRRDSKRNNRNSYSRAFFPQLFLHRFILCWPMTAHMLKLKVIDLGENMICKKWETNKCTTISI